jgi:signal transduction histidine kinase
MTSFPVLLAASFVFPPYAAGLVSLLGTFDKREFRREIPASRGLFNRSNVAISVMAASVLFHALDGSVESWPEVLPIALAALVVDLAINSLLLIAGTRLLTNVPISTLIRNVYGASQPLAFASGYVCFGLLAVVLATTYLAAGTWGLLAFAIPLLLARQMFVHWKQVGEVRVQLQEERQALGVVSSRIVDERRDERLTVAAGIHDEVLPPLYKVHLMGQVLRQDLASGRLLDLEADLPDLLQATEHASAALRDLVRDLRTSPLGPGGLGPTIELLARNLQAESGIKIVVRTEPVPGTPLTHLLVYQVAREALANVVRHSQASAAHVTLSDDGDSIRLAVEDDGSGFLPGLVDRGEHFGLQLMRERVELSGGVFFLESSPNQGTRLVAKVPAEKPKV